MNAPQQPTFEDLLENYGKQAQQPVKVSAGFATRVAVKRHAELERNKLFKCLAAGAAFVLIFAMSAILLQPKTMTAMHERATRQTTEAPYRQSDWNVDVARLTIPAKELFSSIQRVSLPTTAPEVALNGKLPNLGTVPKAALDPLTNGPRRAMTLFLRDTGFGSH